MNPPPPAAPVLSESLWPDAPGFYWWRGAPSFRWQVMQVVAFGADEDLDRLMVYDAQASRACRALRIWKDSGPACGEWVRILPPAAADVAQSKPA